MSDAGLRGDGEEPETPETSDESTGGTGDLLIVTGGIEGTGSDEEPSAPLPDEPDVKESVRPASEFTLDELVAEMAGVSAVAPAAPPAEAAPVPDHVDPLAAAMSEAFAEATPIEAELWTRVPFWIVGFVWAAFVGAMTYLLWPTSAGGLQDAPLYGILVFGGAGLVIVSLVAGLIVWSRARAHSELTDRSIVSRAVLLRVLGWTAGGVVLWVVAMIVLSLHHLDVF